MTITQFRERYDTRPFRPFTIHLADGRSIPVSHPAFILTPPEGRIVAVYHNKAIGIIDLLLVTGLEVPAEQAHDESEATDSDTSP